MTIKEYLLELKKYSPYDFSEYSDNSIQRRLTKILEEEQITICQLFEKTKLDPLFVEKLVNEITVNTTDFFRDPDIWIEYANQHLQNFKKKSLKIWHAGSSSGQEVFSNLMLLEHFNLLHVASVFASDINKVVIEEGKKGVFRYTSNHKSIELFEGELKKLDKDHSLTSFNSRKYLDVDEAMDLITVKEKYRKVPVFVKHNLVCEPVPFDDKFDIIFCRNVLIYFNTNLQSKILKMFYECLNNGGILVLGNHEGVSGFFKSKFVKTGSFFSRNNEFHFNY